MKIQQNYIGFSSYFYKSNKQSYFFRGEKMITKSTTFLNIMILAIPLINCRLNLKKNRKIEFYFVADLVM